METKRIRYFSDLRAIACMAVVVLHSFFCAFLVYQPGVEGELVSLMVRNCTLWAVPAFVMVTGALLLSPERELTVYHILHKYVKRAVLALVLFTFVFAVFDACMAVPHLSVLDTLKNFVINLFTNHSWLHMWYLYMLIGIYLCLPAFRLITAHADDQTLRYIILILFLFQACVPTVNFFLKDTALGFYIPVYTVYPLYLFLGYAIHTDKLKVSRSSALSMLICSTIAILAVTYAGVKYSSTVLLQMASSYACVLVVFQTVGVFVLMKGTEEKPEKGIHRFLCRVDECSFGIYLMHVLFIYLIYRTAQFNPFTSMAGLKMAGVTVFAFLASWAATFLLKHVPGIRNII